MSDPKRLLDDLGGGELKDLLAAGRSELPDEAKLLALATKIGVAGALGGAGAAGAAGAGGGAGAGAKAGAAVAAVKGATAIKIGVAVAVVSAAGAGTVVVATHETSVADATRPSGIVATPSVTATSTATSVASERLSRIDPLASASAEPSAKTIAPAVTKSAAPNPSDEVKLLERAQDALKSRPADALATCNEHAKSYPNGMLAQEREVIAIEALMKLGRTAEANARADRFKTRYPGSSHARRIDAILGR